MQQLSTTSLPHITIQKIYINRDNVTVNAYLTTNDKSSSPFWMEEKYFTDFIDVHFMLVHDGADFAAKLADPISRAANNMLTDPITNEIQLVTDWVAPFKERYNTTTVTLKEAVNRDSENVVALSGINNSGTQRASNLKDIAFSIEIPVNKFTLSSEGINSLKLYVFSHLNVSRLVQAFNLSEQQDSIIKLLEIGGNFKQDLILQKVEGELRVPDTIDILTFEDGTPFNGAYHYHGATNPGPNGYIGWMEGPAAPHMMPNARTLKTTSIEYSKVVANFLFDDRLFISGYNGAAEEMDALENNYNSPWVQTKSTYDALFESDNGYSPDTLIKIYDPEVQQDLISKAFREQSNHTPFDIVYNSDRDLTVDRNGAVHELEFEINYEKLIRIKSKFPFFIKRMEEQFGYTKQQILDMATIKRISISRYRLSNSPRSNNPVCTADYDVYDTDEINKVIAVTSQEDQQTLITPVSRPSPEDRVVFRELASDEEGVRKFKVWDWDLAENVNFGKYAYRVDISIDDSIKKLIIGKVEGLREIFAKYQEFLFKAPSNLKFATTTYTDEFKRSAQSDYGTAITALINEFVAMHGLLGSLELSNRQALRRELKRSISPETGDLATATRFADQCQDLLRTYSEILKKDNVLQVAGDSTSAMVQSTVKLGNVSPTNVRSNSIEFSRRIPGYTEAYVPGDLFVSYGLSELLNMRLEQIETLEQRARGLTAPEDNPGIWAIPDSIQYARSDDEIIQIFERENWARQSEYDHMQWTSKLDNIIRTPNAETELQIKALVEGELTKMPTHGIPGLTHVDPDSQSLKQPPGDINTSATAFKSKEDKTGLTEVNEKALVGTSDSFDETKSFNKDEARNKADLNKYKEKDIYEKLEGKITKALKSKAQKESSDFFKEKKSKVMMKVGKSAEAEYVEVTKENLQKHKGEKVKIKVASEGQKNGGEKYKTVNTTAVVSVKELEKALNNQTQASMVTAGAANVGSTTYNL